MQRKQYIAAGIVAAALFAEIYVVPALSKLDNLLPAMIVGVAGILVMGVAVFKGGLTEIESE